MCKINFHEVDAGTLLLLKTFKKRDDKKFNSELNNINGAFII